MNEIEALIEAVKVRDVAGVKAMVAATPALANARMPDGESPVMAALYRGHYDVIDVLLEAGAEVDIFVAAAMGRTEDLRRALQDAGAVNVYAYDGWTPLHLAAFFGRLDAARTLVDGGADVRAVSRNSLTNTPLHAATAGKHGDVALLLLAHGADPRVVDAGGYTPLQIASHNQLVTVVEAISGGQQ